MGASRPGFYLEDIHVKEIVDSDELFIKLQNANEEDKEEIVTQIFLNNLGVIHHIISKRIFRQTHLFNRYRITYDDVFSALSFYLLHAIRRFDIDKGSRFISLAYVSINNGLTNYITRLKDRDVISLDKPVSEHEDSQLDYKDTLESEELGFNGIEDMNAFNSVIKELEKVVSPRDLSITLEYITGDYTQSQLAVKYGVAQMTIGRSVKKVQKMARSLRDEEMFELV